MQVIFALRMKKSKKWARPEFIPPLSSLVGVMPGLAIGNFEDIEKVTLALDSLRSLSD